MPGKGRAERHSTFALVWPNAAALNKVQHKATTARVDDRDDDNDDDQEVSD